jgi:hypothetical protein
MLMIPKGFQKNTTSIMVLKLHLRNILNLMFPEYI